MFYPAALSVLSIIFAVVAYVVGYAIGLPWGLPVGVVLLITGFVIQDRISSWWLQKLRSEWEKENNKVT